MRLLFHTTVFRYTFYFCYEFSTRRTFRSWQGTENHEIVRTNIKKNHQTQSHISKNGAEHTLVHRIFPLCDFGFNEIAILFMFSIVSEREKKQLLCKVLGMFFRAFLYFTHHHHHHQPLVVVVVFVRCLNVPHHISLYCGRVYARRTMLECSVRKLNATSIREAKKKEEKKRKMMWHREEGQNVNVLEDFWSIYIRLNSMSRSIMFKWIEFNFFYLSFFLSSPVVVFLQRTGNRLFCRFVCTSLLLFVISLNL